MQHTAIPWAWALSLGMTWLQLRDIQPYTGPTAFMLGNEGQGMTPRQMALCDKFVYISQYGAG